jgi:hypothetical protein
LNDTKSNLFEKTYEYLADISNIRKKFSEKKMSEIKNFINVCLRHSDIYDFINSKLKINDKIIEVESKELLRKLLNYAHDQKDIFLYIDVNIREENNINHIELTNYRKLLEIISSYFLFSQDILISKELSNYYSNLVYYSKLKDYFELGIEEIPPYRIYNYEAEKMIYYELKSISNEINRLKDIINNFNINNAIKLKKKNKEILEQYLKKWWETYKNISQKTYPGLCNHFSYYNGVDLKVLVCKNNKKIPNTVHDSDLALCVAKHDTNSGDIKINFNNYIKEITFLDEEIGNDFEDVTIDLGLGFDSYKEDSMDMIKSSIKIELKEELVRLFEINFNEISYKKFTSEILSLMGMDIIKKNNNNLVIKRDFLTGKSLVYSIIRFEKDEDFDMKKVLKYKTSNNNYLIICQTVVTETIKNKFIDIDNIIIKDVNDFFREAKNFIFKNINLDIALINEIIYPFLKENIVKNEMKELKVNKAENLINKLKNCPVGLEGWKQFENICNNILKFVFEESFENFNMKIQSRNYNGKDIRDIILSNTSEITFWNNVRHFYNCNNIIIECKNKSSTIGNDGFRQISDYLGKDAIGQFGIILSRKGLSDGGRDKQRDYLYQRPKKLILVLSEQDIIDLVKIKSFNDYPEKVLENLKFEVETNI